MSEDQTVRNTDVTSIGEVNISNEVIEIITNISAMEVEGVTALAGNLTEDIAGIFSRKQHTKGVGVTIDESGVAIEINLIVRFGVKVPEVAWRVQENVKTAVESMTGMNVASVNINIAGINY